MIQIDIIEILLKQLKDKGWQQNKGYAQRGNPRVLERNGQRIAVVKPIKIDPFKKLQNEIDNFFRLLIKVISKNEIKDIYIPGGGTISIPQFFSDYCKENGIQIHQVTSENINRFEKKDF